MYKGAQNSTKAVERGLPAIDWPGKAGQNRGTTITPCPHDMFISTVFSCFASWSLHMAYTPMYKVGLFSTKLLQMREN